MLEEEEEDELQLEDEEEDEDEEDDEDEVPPENVPLAVAVSTVMVTPPMRCPASVTLNSGL